MRTYESPEAPRKHLGSASGLFSNCGRQLKIADRWITRDDMPYSRRLARPLSFHIAQPAHPRSLRQVYLHQGGFP